MRDAHPTKVSNTAAASCFRPGPRPIHTPRTHPDRRISSISPSHNGPPRASLVLALPRLRRWEPRVRVYRHREYAIVLQEPSAARRQGCTCVPDRVPSCDGSKGKAVPLRRIPSSGSAVALDMVLAPPARVRSSTPPRPCHAACCPSPGGAEGARGAYARDVPHLQGVWNPLPAVREARAVHRSAGTNVFAVHAKPSAQKAVS